MDTHPRYTWTLLRAGRLLLDGGGMFGLIPRIVWSREVETDDKGRVALAHNCLLLEGERGTPAEGRRVVIETGTGDKLDAKLASIFGIDSWIGEALGRQSCDPESVTDVVVSHLHFDHAGGLTRLCREGEEPDWVGPGSDRREVHVKRTFPNARVHVQAREWSDALANRSVMTKTYYRDHLEPIQSQLALCDSPRPFPTGYIPDRDEQVRLPIEHRTTEVIPGIRVFLCPGHTWGQQAILFTDAGGREMVFTPDVMPTHWHVGAAYSLAYDVEPYMSMVSRRNLLADAAERGWTLVLDHEPGEPFFAVRPDSRGWYTLVPVGRDPSA